MLFSQAEVSDPGLRFGHVTFCRPDSSIGYTGNPPILNYRIPING